MIDVKPGSASTPINLESDGVVAVAVLTTASFDASALDARSACFGDDGDPNQRDCTEAHARGHVEDVDGNGSRDLLLHFELSQTGIDPGDSRACLTGRTSGGTSVEGCDTITVHG